MALAPFFDKTALAAANVLHGFDRDAFASLLEAQTIEIAYDEEAASSNEGKVALELITNLLARLYPQICFTSLGAAPQGLSHQLETLATSINPHIEFASAALDREVTVSVVVGATELPSRTTPVIYVGSDGWIVRLSSECPIGCGDSANPFGAAAAACFGAANVFRVVFASQLQSAALDRSIRMSVLDLNPGAEAPPNPKLGSVALETVHLIGIGAIGSGFIWSLARAATVSGTLEVVDGETLDSTNPQRYVIALPTDERSPKTDLAVREFGANGSAVIVRAHPMTWGRYLTTRESGEPFRTVAVAVDSARDRIAVQASLPREVLNAWTQAGDLGVSRHRFGDGACLACLYLRDTAGKNEDVIVAEAIGLPTHVLQVRELLHSGRPAGAEMVRAIAAALGVDSEPLMAFADRPLRSFYSEAVCGGLLMRLGAKTGAGGTEVPLAFQSALAGVLLAASVVGHAAKLPHPAGTKAVIDLLRPLGSHLSVPVAQHSSGCCICQDPDFTDRYAELHSEAAIGGV